MYTLPKNCISCLSCLFLLVSVLFANTAKADIVVGGSNSGTEEWNFLLDFDTVPAMVSETFTLSNSNQHFTSLELSPDMIFSGIAQLMNVNKNPSYDVYDTYTGPLNWDATLKINGISLGTVHQNTSGVYNFTPATLYPVTSGNPYSITGILDASFLYEGLYTIDETWLLNNGLQDANSLTVTWSLDNASYNLTNPGIPIGMTTGIIDLEGTGTMYVAWTSTDNPPPATPEPATMLIFGIGAAGAGIAACRKNHSRK